MLIDNLKAAVGFSDTEKEIANYILQRGYEIEKMSINELAAATYTSPATIVRFCKKVGVKGYLEFRIKFHSEYEKISSFEKEVNENEPFQRYDSYEEVAINLANICMKSILETRRGFDYPLFHKIVQKISKCNEIIIIGQSSSLFAASEFRMKMLRLGWKVYMEECISIQRSMASNVDEKTCAIIISNSGENPLVYEIVSVLKKQKAICIAITSDNNSQIAKKAHYAICTGSQEQKSYVIKLESFTSHTSIHYILDCLYSFIYLNDYEINKEKNIARAKENEKFKLLEIEDKNI